MAANDLHVIVYKLLTYIYECNKLGRPVKTEDISHDSELIGNIPYRYWAQSISEISRNGLIGGITTLYYYDSYNPPQFIFEDVHITLKGEQYLEENSMMRKAFEFIKEAKATIPLI